MMRNKGDQEFFLNVMDGMQKKNWAKLREQYQAELKAAEEAFPTLPAAGNLGGVRKKVEETNGNVLDLNTQVE